MADLTRPTRIMSGDYSRDMWDAINSAKTVAELRCALYLVCCRLQELEGRIMKEAEIYPLRPADKKRKMRASKSAWDSAGGTP